MSPRDPGRLRHRLKIVGGERTSDGAGGYTETAVDEEYVHAGLRRLSGSERVRAMQTHADATHEIEVRAGVTLTADQQLQTEDGRTFHLISPLEDIDERGEWLRVLAREEY